MHATVSQTAALVAGDAEPVSRCNSPGGRRQGKRSGCETTFGIRTIRFDAEKGFFLNGKPVKIKGTCNHQDHAGVGEAIPDRIQAYRSERLKGWDRTHARTSHNPPTPEFLDACDQMGMLVMDETRMMSSNPEGLQRTGAPGQAGP